jgi:GNAT superfamily N-acetyltransferase
MEFLQITMVRPDLFNIPQHEFPKGYSLRRFRQGDVFQFVAQPPSAVGICSRPRAGVPQEVEAKNVSEKDTWVRVQQLAEPFYTIDQTTFDKNFGPDVFDIKRAGGTSRREIEVKSVLAMSERSFFLVAPDGSDVGTITAWYDLSVRKFPGQAVGRIHWVCIVPLHQRKGLCRPMMTAAMNRLKSLGHEIAVLGTQTPRLAAIKVYLDFGFLPDLDDDEARRAWRLVKQELPHPALAGV